MEKWKRMFMKLSNLYQMEKWKASDTFQVYQEDISSEAEEWKDIEDFPGYQISNMGQIKSFKTDKVNGKLLKITYRGCKPAQINLQKDGKKYGRCVHKLVAQAFVPNPNNYPWARNIDGNRFDNRAVNIEWVSYSKMSKWGVQL